MSNTPTFDKARAHQFFAADCFNRAWGFIERTNRSAEDDEQMRALSHASLWHWMQRDDCTVRNLAIAYWQLSRVYALIGRAEDAARYGEMCLHHSKDEGPFYLGYAHEALARSARAAGDIATMRNHLGQAHKLAAEVSDAEERVALEKDLDALQ